MSVECMYVYLGKYIINTCEKGCCFVKTQLYLDNSVHSFWPRLSCNCGNENSHLTSDNSVPREIPSVNHVVAL